MTNLKELKEAALLGKLKELEGFREKTEKAILEELAEVEGKTKERRIKLMEAEQIVKSLV